MYMSALSIPQRVVNVSLHCRYLALGNDRKEFFALTTPLFRTHDNVFSLMVPGYQVGLLGAVRTCNSSPCSRLMRVQDAVVL